MFPRSCPAGESPYDVAIVGAGAVGCGLAYVLSQYRLKVLLLDKNHDVGAGTSNANSAIIHTGFDATPGSLESELVTRASRQWPELCRKLTIPLDPAGAILLAVDDEQSRQLPKIHDKALANGVDDVVLVDAAEAKRLEPNASSKVLGGLLVPRESLGDPFTTCVALTEVALANGTDILLGTEVLGIEEKAETTKRLVITGGHKISARLVVNVSGLGSRRVADLYGGGPFDINPRRGQFLVYDKLCRPLVNRILLPVPTARTKGILVAPTIYGNLLAGPTAEDLSPDAVTATETTHEGLQQVLEGATRLLPSLPQQPPIATYAGLRCHCEQGSYQIRYNDGENGFVTATGIRSTGFTTCVSLGEYLAEGLGRECGLELAPDPTADKGRPNSEWPGWWNRPYDNEERLAEKPGYAQMVCFCEQISRQEILDALDSPLKPRILDGLKRRTRTSMGRCQSFECGVHLAEIVSEHCGIPIERITKKGPGSTLTSRTAVEGN